MLTDSPATGGDPGHPDEGADRDESGRLRDRAANRRDTAGDERDLAGRVRDVAADRRDVASEDRDRAADARDEASDDRDRAASERDMAATTFDSSSAEQDSQGALRIAHAREEAATDRRVSAEDRHSNAGDRKASARERASAGSDRVVASTDRRAGGSARNDAQVDRAAASADRDRSASDREAAHLDELTGTYRRGPGFVELEREVLRSAREHEALAVAFVDVDHLKSVNDSLGHAAGDRLLRQVADAIASRLRPYDLVIRYGGDEFVCVLPGLTAAAATERLVTINNDLRAMEVTGSVSIGIADLQPDDSMADLVERADQSLYTARGTDY
jgi:diguanylate cyclase (GGDEF)-like protein